jgi:hypothetical protein
MPDYRKELEQFIEDMNNAPGDYPERFQQISDRINNAEKAIVDAEKLGEVPAPLREERNAALSCGTKEARAFRQAKAAVLEKHGIPVPKDYFSCFPCSPISDYEGDVIDREEIVNKSKVKLYTFSEHGRHNLNYKIFTLSLKDGAWRIVKVRHLYDPETGKDEAMDW